MPLTQTWIMYVRLLLIRDSVDLNMYDARIDTYWVNWATLYLVLVYIDNETVDFHNTNESHCATSAT